MTRKLAGALCALLLPVIARAQVGHTPQTSPFRDLQHRQELSWSGGYYRAATEPVGVGPHSGPMLGVHWEYRMGGPAYLTANMAGVLSKRDVIDPVQAAAERFVGTKDFPLLLSDVGFALNLTGFKSWHGMVPSIGAGVGVAAGLDGGADVGGFRVGTPFLLAFRTGIKFAPQGKWQGRIEAANFLYRIRYPNSYFLKTGADDPVLPVDASRTRWTRNLGLTLGLTYAYGR